VDVALGGFLIAQRTTGNLRLFLLGGGSQEQKIRSFVNENNLQDRVHFCGYKQNQDLAGYYQAADLYLSASHIDGSSVALMEAMACGCIPVVSDIPANLEWVKHGEQGLVFSHGNAENLAENLVYAEKSRQLFQTWSNNARKKTQADADWVKNKQKLLEIYERFNVQKN
jgi:glycosyltransferase involved in cell wall biosynthesis